MIEFKFDTKFDTTGLEKVYGAGVEYAQFLLDQQVIKDSNFYIPMDEHYLERSALIASQIGKGLVVWQTPYARRLYYNPQYNFSTDVNPNARGLWFEHSKSERKDDWIKLADEAVKQYKEKNS